ncbi:hypothetical protein [Streptomyces sp. CB02261]|uniref:hypothetical protein n=1 Tax=Streptomyces sp. CB02261 TaxID=1703940 RepID=UPI00093F679B|nr:hypothetical protein [Streptomyces sp. CB02261]OKJ62575.1 hypothetical protein AMK29_20860 [Streptomyces sp. CB02261]
MPPRTERGIPGRRRRSAPGALVAFGAAAVLALAGCSDDGADGAAEDRADATAAFCEELTDLREHSGEMRNIDPSETVQGIQDVRADMVDDLGSIREAAADAGVNTDALQAAFQKLDVAMDHLDRNMTAPAALEQVVPHLNTLDKEITNTEDLAGCVRQ